jgi:hypothetical protein
MSIYSYILKHFFSFQIRSFKNTSTFSFARQIHPTSIVIVKFLHDSPCHCLLYFYIQRVRMMMRKFSRSQSYRLKSFFNRIIHLRVAKSEFTWIVYPGQYLLCPLSLSFKVHRYIFFIFLRKSN